MKFVQSAGGLLTQMRFEFGKSHFNGIEIGTVRRQVADAHLSIRKQPTDVLDCVSGKVIEDERVALAQLGTEPLLKINREHLGIDGAFDQKRSLDAVMAQGRNEGGALPVAMRDGAETTLADRTATMVACQLGI